MSFMPQPPPLAGEMALAARLARARRALKPPPRLSLIEWAETYRKVATKNSATPGQWQTIAQPVAFGMMAAVTEPDTHTVTVMAGTQVVKTELCINAACYFIHQDPSPILFVQPTQNAAEAFSKERFAPTIDVTPELRALIAPSRSRDSENTIIHKGYPGGSIDFVGANSPTDLASRPKRIVIEDEIDKYPASAGAEGDPVKLAEERASTYHALGRAKFLRTCSPTEEGTSRIGREYKASDQRKCFVGCPHCGHEQVLTWAHVRWDRDTTGGHLPATAAIACEECGTLWNERERAAALDALATKPGYGWRQTKEFICCEVKQKPSRWDDRGRARCEHCEGPAPYGGHAGFHASKLYSRRHRLADLVKEFLEAQGDPDLLRKFTNTGLAELWQVEGREKVDIERLQARAELYGPDDLPDEILVITAFTDVQGDRLETQVIGWGENEESWPFLYEVIHSDPAQPSAWNELDALHRRTFKNRSGRILRIAAAGIDTGGHHGSQVYDYCRRRRGRRIFATKGVAGKRPIWPTVASRSKLNDPVWLLGVDSAKDAIFGRLKIEPNEDGSRKPGLVHFRDDDSFGAAYFEQLAQSEYREQRKRLGQVVTVWVQRSGKPNEALDTFVGALAVRRSLPRQIERTLEFGLPPLPEPEPPLPQQAPAHPARAEAPKTWLDTGGREWL